MLNDAHISNAMTAKKKFYLEIFPLPFSFAHFFHLCYNINGECVYVVNVKKAECRNFISFFVQQPTVETELNELFLCVAQKRVRD